MAPMGQPMQDIGEPLYQPHMFKPQKPIREEGHKFHQEIDTNVFSINMSTLKQGSELATGDPIFCTTCQAAFNLYSKYEEVKADDEEPK